MFEPISAVQNIFPVSIHKLAVRDNQPCEEALLTERAMAGHFDAFNDLVEKYQDAVYRQAFWLLGEETAAEDAAQEAFYRAYTKIHTYCGPSFRAWILRITTNYCLDILRKQKSHRTVSLEYWDPDNHEETDTDRWLASDQPTPEQQVERLELNAAIQFGFLKLSPEDRMPILLVDLQEMNYQEASEVLRIPMGTFKSRLSRARARLVGVLQPYLAPGMIQ